MAMSTKAVVKDVKIADIRVGDKLLQDVTGMDGRTLIMQGTHVSHREIVFLRKQLLRTIPKRPPERYVLGKKSAGMICDKNGECLVRAGQVASEELLAPLLAEGFEKVPTEGGGEMLYRKNEWPKGEPWHINDFNPLVRVETMSYVDEDGKEKPDPRGAAVRVGPETSAKRGKEQASAA